MNSVLRGALGALAMVSAPLASAETLTISIDPIFRSPEGNPLPENVGPGQYHFTLPDFRLGEDKFFDGPVGGYDLVYLFQATTTVAPSSVSLLQLGPRATSLPPELAFGDNEGLNALCFGRANCTSNTAIWFKPTSPGSFAGSITYHAHLLHCGAGSPESHGSTLCRQGEQDGISPISEVATLNVTITGRAIDPNAAAAIQAVPLPAAAPLFIAVLGLAGLFGWRRTRRPSPRPCHRA
jgi:hypothetical protein